MSLKDEMNMNVCYVFWAEEIKKKTKKASEIYLQKCYLEI